MLMSIYGDDKRPGRCRSCGKAIVWAILKATGEPHPFNAPLVITGTQPELFTARSVEDVDTKRSPSHFATCPHARSHRKPQPK
jgi:hypothetical protein